MLGLTLLRVRKFELAPRVGGESERDGKVKLAGAAKALGSARRVGVRRSNWSVPPCMDNSHRARGGSRVAEGYHRRVETLGRVPPRARRCLARELRRGLAARASRPVGGARCEAVMRVTPMSTALLDDMPLAQEPYGSRWSPRGSLAPAWAAATRPWWCESRRTGWIAFELGYWLLV